MTQQTGGGQSEDSEATSRFNALKSSVRKTSLKEEAGGNQTHFDVSQRCKDTVRAENKAARRKQIN